MLSAWMTPLGCIGGQVIAFTSVTVEWVLTLAVGSGALLLTSVAVAEEGSAVDKGEERLSALTSLPDSGLLE